VGATVHDEPWPRFLYSFLIMQALDMSPWARDQPTARRLPTQDNTNRINAGEHPCLEWYSNSDPNV
jgi:hypothetical protein